MTMLRRSSILATVTALAVVSLHAQQDGTARRDNSVAGFRFRSGVDLVNVTATVTDAAGRFVPGLRQDDFRVYEDDQPQVITHFSNERVPVSLGLVVDTSGSMDGEKLDSAQRAIERFLYDLMGPDDEFFIDRFNASPQRLQEWTGDRLRLSAAIRRVSAAGGTAMYDAVADAVPYASTGRNRKKAIVLISDGNDTSSSMRVGDVKQVVRESEVLVYAIGIDGDAVDATWTRQRPRIPIPIPLPGGRRFPFPIPGGGGGGGRGGVSASHSGDRVNVGALREITDDTGGRTEIIRGARDLDPATSRVADELSKQYYLAYQGGGTRDRRWHSIRVEVNDSRLRVRARKGYVAS